MRAFFRSLLRILDARELGAGSSNATRHTLAKHVIAKLEPETRITVQSRSLARKRIQEAREFLRSKWEDSHAKYLRARFQAEEGGDGIPPDVGRIIKKSRHPKSTHTRRDRDRLPQTTEAPKGDLIEADPERRRGSECRGRRQLA